MGKLGQGLALAGALGGAFGCEDEGRVDELNRGQANISMQQQGLNRQDLANLGNGRPIPWSLEGDNSVNFCELDGQKLMIFTRRPGIGGPGLSLSYVKCDETIQCIEEGVVEEVQGLPMGFTYFGGFIYSNANGEPKLSVNRSGAGERSPAEFNVRFNANNQLEVFGDPVEMVPELQKIDMESYFLDQNGVPSLFWNNNDAGGRTRNLITGLDTILNGNLAVDAHECGNAGVDSSSGMVIVGQLRRDARGNACRIFYGDSVDDQQLSLLNVINNDPQYADQSLMEARPFEGGLVYTASPRRAGFEALTVLHYAPVQPAAPQDAGTPDATVDAATDAGVDANAGGAGGAGGSGGIQALDAAVGGSGGAGGSGAEGGTGGSGGIQAPDAGMAGAGGTGGIQSPDAAVGGSGGSGGAGAEGGTGGSGGIQTPDAGAAGSGGTGGIQSPDAGMAGSGGTGGSQSPDAGMGGHGGSPSPDSGLGGTPGPDARPPAELAPFDVTLLTGNCIERVLGNVVIAGIHYTKEEIEGDGTQICEVEIATADGGKIPAKLTIRNDRQRTMRVTILLPFDPNANPISETTTPRTGSRPKEEQHGGVHINNQNLGIVTSSAASEFETMRLDESEDGRIKFLVASFNKPEEPQVFEIFPDGSRLAVNSDGKTYEVNIETREITEKKLREIPTCVENDPTCEIETGGSSGEGGAGGSDVPGENGGKSGCDCSIGGRTLPQAEFYALLMALGLAYRRREKSKN